MPTFPDNDVVVLGATHWMFNPGVLPWHLNRKLKQPVAGL